MLEAGCPGRKFNRGIDLARAKYLLCSPIETTRCSSFSVCPGGGFNLLVWNAAWMASLTSAGVALSGNTMTARKWRGLDNSGKQNLIFARIIRAWMTAGLVDRSLMAREPGKQFRCP
jgi:hypothetical protein